MSKAKTGQVSTKAAEVYEEFFIPALFHEWAAKVAEAARIGRGQRILDVACGTGVLAREIANRIGPEGSVVGLDVNEGMLAVAGKKSPGIEWRQGRAEDMPFESASFDRVVSQFGLMFFTDRPAALREMMRVLKTGGRLTVAVWDTLENAPGYKKVVGLLDRLFGADVAEALRSPYSLGEVQILRSLFEEAEVNEFEIKTLPGQARFPSIESWMFTDVRGWTLADVLDEEQYQLLLKEAQTELRPFLTGDGAGTVLFDHPAHLVTAKKA